jgi:hypothetical protein
VHGVNASARDGAACRSHCSPAVQVLHVLSCLLRVKHTDQHVILQALGYLEGCLRARQYTAVDIAQTAHVIGTWRGGPGSGYQGLQAPVVQAVVAEIENAAIELMQIGELSPRQLSNVFWMFGRMQQQPSQFVFAQLAARMITERVRASLPPDMPYTRKCALLGNSGLQDIEMQVATCAAQVNHRSAAVDVC